jgi:hypothetical protein
LIGIFFESLFVDERVIAKEFNIVSILTIGSWMDVFQGTKEHDSIRCKLIALVGIQ